MNYFATFTANNGRTYIQQAREYTNKQKAISDIRSTCWAEHFQQIGNTSKWRVCNQDDIIVASGEIHDFGRFTRTENLY